MSSAVRVSEEPVDPVAEMLLGIEVEIDELRQPSRETKIQVSDGKRLAAAGNGAMYEFAGAMRSAAGRRSLGLRCSPVE